VVGECVLRIEVITVPTPEALSSTYYKMGTRTQSRAMIGEKKW